MDLKTQRSKMTTMREIEILNGLLALRSSLSCPHAIPANTPLVPCPCPTQPPAGHPAAADPGARGGRAHTHAGGVNDAIGGGLLVTAGADVAYLFIGAIFVVAALVATTLVYTPLERDRDAATSPFAHLVGGLRYVRTSRLLIGVLMVTILFNLVFSPYQSMIPVIGKEILGANALRVGLLSATEGFGAVCGALWIANRARPEGYPRIYFYGTGLFLLCALGFSQSETYALSSMLLFMAGFGLSAFAVMQTTILVRATNPAMRGRVLGVLSLAIGAGPAGALQVGPLVAGLGEQTTLTVLVLEGLVGLVLVGAVWPMLRQAWLDPLAGIAPADAPTEQTPPKSG
jgi:hypothetical protein